MKRRTRGIAAVVALAGAAILGVSSFHSSHSALEYSPRQARDEKKAWEAAGLLKQRLDAEQAYIDHLAAVQAYNDYLNGAAYANAVNEALRAQAARRSAPARVASRGAQSPGARIGSGGGGGSCGGATNGADRYIGRESGGNPNARNPSGAWGCYQIMPGTWNGSCSDLGSHGSASTEAQAACASRLPHSSWSASGPVG